MKERFERLEETLQIAHQMRSGDETASRGTHYRLDRPLNAPLPVRTPHLPIMMGGSGEKKTLRMVAQYADTCNIFDMGPEAVKAKYDVMDGHWAATPPRSRGPSSLGSRCPETAPKATTSRWARRRSAAFTVATP